MDERFEFGRNWRRFLHAVNDERIERAKRSLQTALGVESLEGKTFLDAGSGSGLLSLAARKLGATVRSFDFDPESVACTNRLKELYFPNDQRWTIEEASVLDADYLRRLGRFDVVYSWGVLHHTGDMWAALGNVLPLVLDGGLLFVSIYNDQGRASLAWRWIKKLYNRTPSPLRPLILLPCAVRLWGPTMARDLLRLKPFRTWRSYRQERGMSPWRDLLDWVGGYPFQVARPEEVVDFCRAAGLELLKLKTCGGGHGCNQFVFQRRNPRHDT
ncbi:MAG: class I SAM-dependent methyltransferase [Planctomycetes bacterium]|nr:class I SAM-dependent methyltransferase [Planctomycetota bacterium]MBU4399094.1 class I SAM-dependent methyltransferase [Planctomycetota bacterium]MCG2682947.1 class I SAM-dependent methyltransferase [Planctomycetales bacterium]